MVKTGGSITKFLNIATKIKRSKNSISKILKMMDQGVSPYNNRNPKVWTISRISLNLPIIYYYLISV